MFFSSELDLLQGMSDNTLNECSQCIVDQQHIKSKVDSKVKKLQQDIAKGWEAESDLKRLHQFQKTVQNEAHLASNRTLRNDGERQMLTQAAKSLRKKQADELTVLQMMCMTVSQGGSMADALPLPAQPLLLLPPAPTLPSNDPPTSLLSNSPPQSKLNKYSRQLKGDLILMCSHWNLPTHGSKADLIKHLQDNDAALQKCVHPEQGQRINEFL